MMTKLGISEKRRTPSHVARGTLLPRLELWSKENGILFVGAGNSIGVRCPNKPKQGVDSQVC